MNALENTSRTTGLHRIGRCLIFVIFCVTTSSNATFVNSIASGLYAGSTNAKVVVTIRNDEKVLTYYKVAITGIDGLGYGSSVTSIEKNIAASGSATFTFNITVPSSPMSSSTGNINFQYSQAGFLSGYVVKKSWFQDVSIVKADLSVTIEGGQFHSPRGNKTFVPGEHPASVVYYITNHGPADSMSADTINLDFSMYDNSNNEIYLGRISGPIYLSANTSELQSISESSLQNLTIPPDTPAGQYYVSCCVLHSSSSVVWDPDDSNDCSPGYDRGFMISVVVNPPSVTTTAAAGITATTAASGGKVTTTDEAPVTARGVCWSTSANPTTANSKTSNGTGTGSFTSALTGLTPNTLYHIRAYAINSAGTAYGSDLTFTTAVAATAPTVSTMAASEITTTTAAVGGNVTADGGAPVTARGVCWSTSANPTTANSRISIGTGTGSFTSTLTGLTPNTLYHIRAYAINSAGTAYGGDLTFTTASAATAPTVSTTAASGITTTTAASGGNVTADGGAAVTARGVCWSTSANPTTANSKTSNGTGTGSFASALTGLTPNALYHFRAYAINSVGTVYGSDLTFTTAPTTEIAIPTVITTAASGITTTTATAGGNVTADGGATVTARGVCWSISANPTTDCYTTTAGSGVGAFTSALTGLTPNMLYHIRAYAINSAGTAYGSDLTFTTAAAATAPTVSTTAASGITTTTAASGGNVTADGGAAVTARGVCWSTSANPTTANSTTSNGTGTGSFASALTGLTSNTLYHFRAYAINSVGTAYGSDLTFTTASGGTVLSTATLYYECAQTGGVTVIDSRGGNNGRLDDESNVYFSYSSELNRYCLKKLDAKQAGIQPATNPVNNSTFTIACWAKPTTANDSEGGQFFIIDSDSEKTYRMYTDRINYQYSGGSSFPQRNGSFTADGGWHHYAWVNQDNGDGTALLRMYVDGVKRYDGTLSASEWNSLVSSGQKFLVQGIAYSNYLYQFIGEVCNIAVFDGIALDDSQMAQFVTETDPRVSTLAMLFPGAGFALVSVPFSDTSITDAETLAKGIPNCTIVWYWDATAQSWLGHPKGTIIRNFAVVPGGVYLASVSGAGTFSQEGT
ncbi:MAG: hypothetical protein WC708_11090, partial [Lentisphaeria bacterium]